MKNFKQFVEMNRYNANYEAGWGSRQKFSSKAYQSIRDINKYLESTPNPIDWKKIGQWYFDIQDLIESWDKKLIKLSGSNPGTANEDGRQNWFNYEETSSIEYVYKMLTKLAEVATNPYKKKAWETINGDITNLREIIKKVHEWNDKAYPKYTHTGGSNVSSSMQHQDTRGTVRLPSPPPLEEPQ